MFDQTPSPLLGKNILNVLVSPLILTAMFAVVAAVALVMYGNLVSEYVVTSPLAFVAVSVLILSAALFLILSLLAHRRRSAAAQASYSFAAERREEEKALQALMLDTLLNGVAGIDPTKPEQLEIVRKAVAYGRQNSFDSDLPALLKQVVGAAIDPEGFRLCGYTATDGTRQVGIFFGGVGPQNPRHVLRLNDFGVPIRENVLDTARSLAAPRIGEAIETATTRLAEA